MAWGDAYLRVFVNQGEHDYVCLYHPMFGKVVVGSATAVKPAGRLKSEAKGRVGEATERTVHDALGRTASTPSSPYEALIRGK
jgi:hypothetical protein